MRGWGVDYFKIDFRYAGCFEGARHAGLTGVEAYRLGRRLIRDAIGWDALRPQVQRRADWADIVARCGGLRASGDGLHQLDDWGLETTRRLLTPSPPETIAELPCPEDSRASPHSPS